MPPTRGTTVHVVEKPRRVPPSLFYITTMIIKKSLRKEIKIECTECRKNSKHSGISIYFTCKNSKNLPFKIEQKKFCKYCKSHQLHKEV